MTISLPEEPRAGAPAQLASVVEALRRIGYRMPEILRRIDFDYRAFECGLGIDVPTWNQRRAQFVARPAHAGDALDVAIRFMLYGEPASSDALARAFSRDELGALEALGLAVPRDGAYVFPMTCYEIEGLYIVTDRQLMPVPGLERVMPLLPETYEFATAKIRGPFRRALDLGTGSGIHALHASLFCEHVVAVEINSRAAAFARFNKALNRADRVEIRQGDLYSVVAGERFDLITFAPPYGPTEPSSNQPQALSGGPRGDAVWGRALEGLDEHLAERGYAQFCTIMIDWPDETFVQRVDRALGANRAGYDVVLLATPFTFRPQLVNERWSYDTLTPVMRAFMAAHKEYGVLNVRRGGTGTFVRAPFTPPVTIAVETMFGGT